MSSRRPAPGLKTYEVTRDHTDQPHTTSHFKRHIMRQQNLSAEAFDNGKKESSTHSFNPYLHGSSASTSYAHHTGISVRRRPRLFAVMQNMGSLYEEMAWQLISTGNWESVLVKRYRGGSELFVDSDGRSIQHKRIFLLLGEKIPAEKIIEYRRRLVERREGQCHSLQSGVLATFDRVDELLVNCVEKLRCITLKGNMVSTLLTYYSHSWKQLGEYVPLTFRLMPRKPEAGERSLLLQTLGSRSYSNTLWIAKSSSGCHGDGVEIFLNDAKGAERMLNYIDNQKESYMWVVQLYIDKPLLYHRRKFDIRCWVLLCADLFEIYVHGQLVMRMSSVEYDQHSPTTGTPMGRLAHITNHCVQEKGSNFAAFEEGNELWKEHLDALVRYKGRRLQDKGLSHNGANPDLEPSLQNTILPQIYHIVVETLLAAQGSIPGKRSPPMTPCFQVFGYDFLIDSGLRVWLLEINGAPGVAERLLPTLVADTIEIALTPFFPDTSKSTIGRNNISVPNGYVKVYPT